MLEFSIPDSNGTRLLNFLLLDQIKNNPQMFYKDIKITSTYGAMNGCIWNGGRNLLGILSEQDCKEIIDFYNWYSVSYRYTFTNKFIEKRDLYDRYCNMLLRTMLQNTGVTYNKKIIKRFIKRKNKRVYFVSSCTRNINNTKEINKISKKELLVLDFKLNNTKVIEKLKHPENIELVVNEQCMAICPFREIHYTTMAKNNMFIENNKFSLNPMCERKKGTYDSAIRKQPHYVSKQMITNYAKQGINKFKLVGRDDNRPDLALMGYLDYFVKPEYHKAFIDLCKENNII